MKPMIKYRGGKSREIPTLMWHVPRFSGRYVEPFFGGGALFFYLEPRMAIINDVNKKLIEFYKGAKDDFLTLRRELDELEMVYTKNRADFDALKKLHPAERVEDKNEELYYEIRAMFNGLTPKAYSDAAIYYFINKTAYSGMIRYNSAGDFNVPFGRYPHLNTDTVTAPHSALLKRAQIFNTDYSEIFNICEKDDFVFLDPPYDCIFSDYGNEQYKEGFSEKDHRRLAADFANLPCKALMVIGHTPLTDELYHGYITDEYQKNYSVNIRNRFKASASHIVVSNYRKMWSFEPLQNDVEYQDLETSQVRLFEAKEAYGKVGK